MSKDTKSYEELQSELDKILGKIQELDEKGNLTELIELYEKAEGLLKTMQEHLDNAKNTIKKLNS